VEELGRETRQPETAASELNFPKGERKMPRSRSELIQENRDLRDQVAELEDKLEQISDLAGDDEGDEGEGQ
jgi:hypothetical protein